MARRAARGCDAILDAALIGLATWTVVYHGCFVARIGSNAALAAELVVLLAVAGLWWRRGELHRPADEAHGGTAKLHRPGSSSIGRPMKLATAGLALFTAAAMAFKAPWVLVWVPWLLAAVGGLVLAVRRQAEPDQPDPGRGDTGHATWVALLLALAAAVFSLVTIRPNPDDLFYVNLSQWVAAHGDFPHRDTLFSNGTYPMANWPPLASYDAATGALAHLAGVRAAAVVYLVVAPVASALSVLALWRLLRSWRVRCVGLALCASVLFLLMDGTSSYAPPGNLWITRLWQGKVILLCVVVPVLLVWALRYVETPTQGRAARLFVGGVAAVGCSTTAIFLVPVLAVAALAPLVRRAPGKAVTGAVALAAYPLASAVVTLAVGGRSADDFGDRRLYRFDPSWFGPQVFLRGVPAVVGVAAVLLAWRFLPHPAARVTSAVAAVAVGVLFIPGVTRLSYDTVGIGPTLWRLTWALAIGAVVGAVAAAILDAVRNRPLTWTAGAAAAAVVAVTGHPIWSEATNTSFAAPFHWQRGEGSRQVADWMVHHIEPGQRVLGPDDVSITVAVTTTTVKTVAPRDYYMDYLRDVPSFHYADRLALVEFANEDPGWTADQVGAALKTLDVGAVCVHEDDTAAADLLSQHGYQPGLDTPSFSCFTANRHPDLAQSSG